jgi:catechol 2,3-dioxygenase-like lactoylglutathione lyase family enzyme
MPKQCQIEVAAADHQKRVGVVDIAAAGHQADRPLAGVDQIPVDLVVTGGWPDAEDAVLAVQDDLTIGRDKIGNQGRQPDPEVELNLVFNANAGDPAANILMDVRSKFPGYTHIALRVASIPETIAALKENGIQITQGPVSFGESGQISLFVRDPDRNVIELRGREQGVVEGVTRYVP